MRQIVLDTETTGLEPGQDHRIIEIGCVELLNRRLTGERFHQFINPEREVDEGAAQVHGMTLNDLRDKPVFAEIADDFLAFVRDSELVIHNAPFDVGFLDAELTRLGKAPKQITECCSVLDTLEVARRMHPGQRNSLDALCQRYEIDNSGRELHGALLDAEILAEVYLAMTGGQVALFASESAAAGSETPRAGEIEHRPVSEATRPRRVISPGAEELAAHQAYLQAMRESDSGCLWPAEDQALCDYSRPVFP